MSLGPPDFPCGIMKKHPLLTFFVVISAIFVFFVSLIVLFIAMIGGSSPSFGDESIAVINIEGPIFESTEIVKKLHDLETEDSIKSVVLRIDSPGGAVGPSQEIFEQVKLLKQKKKVIVSMGTVAASGGYYIACAADKIVANAGTITGSIGVIMETFGLQRIAESIQVEPRVIKSGRFKDVGSPFRDMTDSDRDYLQALTDDMYLQFVTAVSENRKIDLEKTKEIADGRVYTGQQAMKIGLVDQLGNIYLAIELAKSEAGLPADAKIRWPEEPSAVEKFFSGEESASLSLIRKILGSATTGQVSRMPLWMFQQAQWQ